MSARDDAVDDWTPRLYLVRVAWAVLRCPDPDGEDPTREEAGAEFDRWLEGYTDSIYSLALVKAAEAFDLDDLASTMKIMDDGYPSTFINTNEGAREMVKDWLMARAEKD